MTRGGSSRLGSLSSMSWTYLLGRAIGCLSAAALLVFVISKLVRARRRRLMLDGRGRGVLVTGCDSGFGYQLARRLDQRGFAVFAGCLFPDGDGARSLGQQCSGKLKVLKLDVRSDADVEQAKAAVLQNLPEKGLWAVVNNAGISQWAEIEWSSIQDFSTVVDINLFGAIRTTLAFLPLVRASRGRMVYTSSIFSFFTCLNMAAYSVSKRGLEAFADCLRVEMASFGVKVSIIQPGNFSRATNILKSMTCSDVWEKLDKDKQQVFNRQYMRLASQHFASACSSGFQSPDLVTEAMLHAISAPRPKHRYLLVSTRERAFFKLLPFLPTVLTDGIFSFSKVYAQRKAMLYR